MDKHPAPFNARTFLKSAGLGKRVVDYAPGTVIFSQGGPSDSVIYIRSGAVRLSALSEAGRGAIVSTLGRGDFIGEEALAGHAVRLLTATAATATSVLVVPKREMIRLLHRHRAFADRFIAHMLVRNTRLSQDLIDQLFNSSEKRLARTLLLLARYGAKKNAGLDAAENLPDRPCGDGRDHAFAREPLHEQVQEAGLHRVQRQPDDQSLTCDSRRASVARRREESPAAGDSSAMYAASLAMILSWT